LKKQIHNYQIQANKDWAFPSKIHLQLLFKDKDILYSKKSMSWKKTFLS